jgi:hypothetical protein
LPDVLPGNPAVFTGDPWFSDPAFLRVWFCLEKIVIGARNPIANTPPQFFTLQPAAEPTEKIPVIRQIK